MITINNIVEKKGKEKISMITAYDYPSAKIADEAGVDIILVGDSLGMVILGYDSTLPVTVDEMIHHSKAVNRGRKNSFLVVDMPYLSYNVDIRDSIYNAGRIIKESSANAVKIEGGARSVETIKRIIENEIPVMGHLGLTPQSVNIFGGYKIQGKDEKAAERIIKEAKMLEEAGVFSIVLEGVPENLAAEITREISIPTIGIGAGKECDGQVLVFHDMLGFNKEVPKFVKKYCNAEELFKESVEKYIKEIKEGVFPGKENIYTVQAEIKKIY